MVRSIDFEIVKEIKVVFEMFVEIGAMILVFFVEYGFDVKVSIY